MPLPGYTSMWESAHYYIGKPWLEGGRSDIGIDCLGHITLTAHRSGFPLDPGFNYGRFTSLAALRTRICQFATLAVPTDAAKGYQVSDLALGDVTCYQDSQNEIHLAVVTPGDNSTPFKLCYVPYKKSCTEVPLYLSELKFRWVFRFPHQDVA